MIINRKVSGGGSGAEGAFNQVGNYLFKNHVIPEIGDAYTTTDAIKPYLSNQYQYGRNHIMETFDCYADSGEYCNSGRLFQSARNLTYVNFHKRPPRWPGNSTYMFATCPALTDITLGAVGYPFATWTTDLAATFIGNTNSGLTITMYVEAESIADIDSHITANQPWGATNATIVYRSSTTGEVLT